MVNFRPNSAAKFILAIVLLGILSLYFLIDPAQSQFFPKCPFYSVTDYYCPGCGSQRAIHNLLNGNFLLAIRHNFLIVLLFTVLIYEGFLLILQRVFNKSFYNPFHSTIITKIILVIVILFWVFRNINIYPFSELAP